MLGNIIHTEFLGAKAQQTTTKSHISTLLQSRPNRVTGQYLWYCHQQVESAWSDISGRNCPFKVVTHGEAEEHARIVFGSVYHFDFALHVRYYFYSLWLVAGFSSFYLSAVFFVWFSDGLGPWKWFRLVFVTVIQKYLKMLFCTKGYFIFGSWYNVCNLIKQICVRKLIENELK